MDSKAFFKKLPSNFIPLVFDFKPQLNRVRAFILRYLERERHILLA